MVKHVDYPNQWGETGEYAVHVEECSKREFAERALETIDGILWCGDDDSSVYVEYADGSVYSCGFGAGEDGRFRKNGIEFGVIDDNGCAYAVCGDYVIDGDDVLRRA